MRFDRIPTDYVETDSLNSRVSAAIWRAEHLEARETRTASHAWAEVSKLEEELAKALPVSEPEGRIARRGAVRAALKAGEHARAVALMETYSSEHEAPKSFRVTLRMMLEDGS